MADCGYWYKGVFHSTKDDLIAELRVDFADKIKGDVYSKGESLATAIKLIPQLVKAGEVTEAPIPSNPSIVRKIDPTLVRSKAALTKYILKKPVEIKGVTEIGLSLSDRDNIQGTIGRKFLSIFINNRDEDELTSSNLDSMVKATRLATKESIYSLQDELALVAEQHEKEDTKDTTEYRKAIQLHSLLGDLVGNEMAFNEYIKNGVNKAILDIGYKVVDTKEGWQTGKFKRDPFMGMTGKMKAKLQGLLEYETDEDGKVGPVLDMLGEPTYAVDTYATIMDLFQRDVTKSLAGKKKMLRHKVAQIKAHPKSSADKWYMVDLLNQLEKKKVFNTYDKSETRQFNTIFNGRFINMGSLLLSPQSGRLINNNDNMSSVFLKVLQTIKGSFDSIRNSGYERDVKSFLMTSNEESASMFDISNVRNGVKKATPADGIEATMETMHYWVATDVTDEAFIAAAYQTDLDTLVAFVDRFHTVLKHKNSPDEKAREYYDTKMRSLFAKELKQTTLEDIEENYIKEIQSMVAGVAARKVQSVLQASRVNINSTTLHTIQNALMQDTPIDKISWVGLKEVGTLTIQEALQGFSKDTLSLLSGKANIAPMGYKTFLKWVLDQKGADYSSTSIRIGRAVISAVADPRAIDHAFLRLRDEGEQKALDRDFVASKSRIYKLIKAVQKGAHKSMPWLNNIFTNPTLTSIRSTWKSTVEDDDNDFLHSLHNFGTYLASISYGYTGNTETLGNPLNLLQEQIGGIPYDLMVREGLFQTPAFSNKDNMYNVPSIDFDAAETGPDGTMIFGDTYVDYYAESVLTPELSRILRFSTATVNVRDKNFNPHLIYATPHLNDAEINDKGVITRNRVQDILPRINLPKGKKSLEAIFGPAMDIANPKNSDAGKALKELREMVRKAAREHLNESAASYISYLVKSKVLLEDGGNYYLNTRLEGVEDFLLMMKPVGSSANRQAPEDLTAKLGQAGSSLLRAFGQTGNALIVREGKEKGTWATFKVTAKAMQHLIIKKDVVAFKAKVEVLRKNVESGRVTDGRARIELFRDFGLEGITLENGIKLQDLYDKAPQKPTEKGFDADKLRLNQAVAAQIWLDSYVDNTVAPTLLHPTYKRNIEDNKTVSAQTRDTPLRKTADHIYPLNTQHLMKVVMNRSYGTGFALQNMQQTVFKDVAFYHKKGTQVDSKGVKTSKMAATHPNYKYVNDVWSTYKNLLKRLAGQVAPAVFTEGSVTTKIIAVEELQHVSTIYNGEKIDGKEVMNLEEEFEYADAVTLITAEGRIQHLLLEGTIMEDQVGDVLSYWNGGSKAKTRAQLDKKYYEGFALKVSNVIIKPRLVGEELMELKEMVDGNEVGTGEYISSPIYIKTAEVVMLKSFVGSQESSVMVKLMKMAEDYEGTLNNENTARDKRVSVRIAMPSAQKLGFPGKPMNATEMTKDETTGMYTVSDEAVTTQPGTAYGTQLRTDSKESKFGSDSGQFENIALNMVNADTRMVIQGSDNKKKQNVLEVWGEAVKESYAIGAKAVQMLLNTNKKYDKLQKILTNELTADEVKELDELASSGEHSAEEASPHENLAALIIGAMKNQSDIDPELEDPDIFAWLEIDPASREFKHPDLVTAPQFLQYLDAIRVAIQKQTIQRKRNSSKLNMVPDIDTDLQMAGMEDGSDILLFDTYVEDMDADQTDLRGTVPTKDKDGAMEVLIPLDMMFFDRNTGKQRKFTYEMLMSDEFSYVSDEGRRVVDTDLLPQELFDAVAFRTPTQALSMTVAVRVVGFLPPSMGNAVIGAKEVVPLMGSDFDIDKLAQYRYNLLSTKLIYEEEDGSETEAMGFKVMRKDSLGHSPALDLAIWDNIKLDILRTVLSDPEVVSKGIITTLDGEDALKPLVDKMRELRVGETNYDEMSFLYPAYQENKRNAGKEADALKGIFAKAARVFAQYRRADVPIFTLNEETGIAESIVIQVGNVKITHFDQEGDQIFGKRDGKEYKTDENISALISSAVDDGTLQLLGALGITADKANGTLLPMVHAGFTASTGIHVINMPFYDSSTTPSEFLETLRSHYNNNKAAENKIKSKSNTKGKDITSADLSILQEGMSEETLQQNLTDLQRALRGDIADLSDGEIIDAIALHHMVRQLKAGYSTTITAFGSFINAESKGITRDMGLLLENYAKTQPGSPYAPIWDILKTIPELEVNVQATGLFVDVLNDLLFNGAALEGTIKHLAKSGIRTPKLFEITKLITADKFRNRIPNKIGLIGRLNSILINSDDTVSEYRNNNVFFRDLVVQDDTITLNKQEGVKLAEYKQAFNSIQYTEDIAGVNMELMFNDLVDFGLTNTKWGLGNSYASLIGPEHQEVSATDSSFDPFMSAVHVANQLPHLVQVGTDEFTPNVPIYRKETTVKKKKVSVIMFKKPGSNRHMEYDLAMIKQRGLRSEYDKTVVMSDPIQTEVGDKVDLSSTIERILTHRAMTPLKKLLKATTTDVEVVKGAVGTHSSFELAEGSNPARMTLADGSDYKRLKAAVVHEGTHVALMSILNSYLSGNLMKDYPGIGVDGKAVAAELDRVIKEIEASHGRITDNLVDRAVKSAKIHFGEVGNLKKTDRQTVPYKAVISGIINNNFATEFEYGSELFGLLTDKDIMNTLDVQGKEARDIIESVQNILSNNQVFADANLTNDNLPELGHLTQIQYDKLVLKAVEVGMKEPAAGEQRVFQVIKHEDGDYLLATINGEEIEGGFLSVKALESYYSLYNQLGAIYSHEGTKGKYQALYKTGPNKGNLKNPVPTLVGDIFEYQKRNMAEAPGAWGERDWYQGLVYGLQDLHEFTSQAYTFGTQITSKGRKGSLLRGYAQLDPTGKGALSSMPTSVSQVFKKIFEMLKELVDTIIGMDTSNKLWADVTYATLLSKHRSFVSSVPTSGEKAAKGAIRQWVGGFTDLATDIIKRC